MSVIKHWYLAIAWQVEGLPNRVGPFTSEAEAAEWARINVPNGVWQIHPLAQPYAESVGRLKVVRR